MSVLDVVVYIAVAIAALALVPGLWVIGREALRRRRARVAMERLVAARKVIRKLGREPAARVARTLSLRFDPRTIQAALEEAIDEEAQSVELCETLGLREEWERTLREGKAWNERAHAARMLGKLGVASASQSLVVALADPHEDTTVRLAASEALGEMVDEAVIPHLCKALATQDETAAPCVAEALVSFGRTAVGPVARLLDHPHVPARTWAARVLGRIGDPASTLPLSARLSDASAAVRAAAAEALGLIGDSRASHSLVCAALSDPSPAVRGQATGALSHAGDKEAVYALATGLGDPDPHVRSRAIEALSALHPKDRSAIERALFDPCEDVRRSAALTLDRLGAVSAWAAALGDASAESRGAARAALLSIGRAGLSEAIIASAQHDDGVVRAAIYSILGELGLPRHIPALGRALDDPRDEARQSAAIALGRIGGDAVRALLSREKPVGIAEAAWIVARSLAGDPAWIMEARHFVADPTGSAAVRAVCIDDEAVFRSFCICIGGLSNAYDEPPPSSARWASDARRAARVEERIRALAELSALSGPEVTAAIAEVLVSDPSPDVRVLAARALARAPERWLAVPALVRALSDPTQEVVLEASRGLGNAHGEAKGGPRRPSDAPADGNAALRKTTGRLRKEEMQTRESVV